MIAPPLTVTRAARVVVAAALVLVATRSGSGQTAARSASAQIADRSASAQNDARFAPAQTATVSESLFVIRTYPYADPDPVARMGNIYPYFRFQGYTNVPENRRWKIVTLENPWIRLLVAPEMGGKILGAFEKQSGRAFIYYNRVIKFREIAMRGPWTSGGIEFNFGDIGHAPTTASPVDYATRTNDDGSVSCFVGALDLPSGTEWCVEIRVPADRAVFETRSTWCNATELSTSRYHWMNAAADADSLLRVIYPGNGFIGHGGEPSPWPWGPDGRDLSWYRNNNFGSYKSYHVLGVYTDFFGAVRGDAGVIHWSRYTDKPGKKLWIWGLSREGEIWKDLLTDPALGNTQYVELQSGIHFNQAILQSSRTPFKHMDFLPATSEQFTESWFPFRGTTGVTRATPGGVLCISRTGNQVRFTFCPTGSFRGEIAVFSDGRREYGKSFTLHPLEPVTDSAAASGVDFEVRAGTVIRYRSLDDSASVLSRPHEAEARFDWNSAYGLALEGREKSRQRDYDGALASFRASLDNDATYLPGLAGAAETYYRRMQCDSAFGCARRALAVDAYDPASNYVYGLAARQLGRLYDARDGFGIASQSAEYGAAANVQLAELAILDGDPNDAEYYALKASPGAPPAAESSRLIALISRLRGDTLRARKTLRTMIADNPLSHFARCEEYLLRPSRENRAAFVSRIRSELPYETYIELAAFYARLGLSSDALSTLEPAAGNPLADMWRAYLSSSRGDHTTAVRLLEGALGASPRLVFPHRREELAVLRWAEKEKPHWKTEYYLALLCWSLGRTPEARQWFDMCGVRPDYAPLYLARASFRGDDPARALEDSRRALALEPGEWRTHNAVVTFFNEQGRSAEALPFAREAAARFPKSYILKFLLARTLLFSAHPDEALQILDTLAILPFEGARYGRDAYRQACISTALGALNARDTARALRLIDHARLWPERLGAGEPYNADTRPEDFLQARIWRSRGDAARAEGLLRKIAGYSATKGGPGNAQDLIGACAIRDLGDRDRATRYLAERFRTEPGSPVLTWSHLCLQGDDAQARALEATLRSSLLNPSSGDQDFLLVREIVRGGYCDRH